MAVSGLNFVLQVEDAGMAGVYRTLGGQRSTTMNRATEEADATAKDTAPGWFENVPTFRRWTFEAEGVTDEADAAMGDLETAWLNNTQVNVRISTPGAVTYTGLATVSDLSLEGAHDDVFGYTVSLAGSAALTKV